MRRSAPLLLILALVIFSCRHEPRVVISTRGGREVAFTVEVADSPTQRELGLQYRESLPEDRGMLFLFPEERQNVFWMKNTRIPLDMIFIDRKRVIVGIVHQAAPFSLDSRSVGRPSQFVLEINGGLASRHGIAAGDRVRFEKIGVETVRD